MIKFNFKKFGMSVLSFVLVTTVFLSCFVLSASAATQEEDFISSLSSANYGFYGFGVNSTKGSFYNGPNIRDNTQTDSPTPFEGYDVYSQQLNNIFSNTFSWNGRQCYLYLPTIDSSVSGQYKWGGRIWFANVDNNSYRRDDWSGKNLSYYQKPFLSVGKGQTVSFILTFALPQANYSNYGFKLTGNNFNIDVYSNDYSSVVESGVTNCYLYSYTYGGPQPWNPSLSTSLTSTWVALEFSIVASSPVYITSINLEFTGITSNLSQLLIDNMFLFVKDDNSDWGNTQITIQNTGNWFTDLFANLTNFFTVSLPSLFSNFWSNISSGFSNIYGYFGTVIGNLQSGFSSIKSTIEFQADIVKSFGDTVFNNVVGGIRSAISIFISMTNLAVLSEGVPLSGV